MAIVASVTALAFGLRVVGLHASLTGDELFAYDDVHGRSLGAMLHYIGHNQESSPPLYFILAWLSEHLGDPTVTIRWPSIVFGTATVPVGYLLAHRTVGPTPAVVAAALLAVDPFSIWQSAEARPYELLVFCVLVSALLLVRAVDAPRRWSWWWVAYAVSVAAVAYTHYTGVFVLAAQTIWALWARRDRRWLLVAATAGAVVLYIPWVPDYHGSYLGVYNIVGTPLVPSQIAHVLLQAVIGHPAVVSLADLPGTAATVAFLIVVVAGAAVAALGLRGRRPNARAADHSSSILIVWLALAAPIGILAYSEAEYNLLLVRNLASSVPFVLIALAWLITSLRTRSTALAVTASAVLVAVLAVGAIATVSPGFQRADFRSAVSYVNAHARAGDTLIDASVFPLVTGYRRFVPAYFDHRYAITTPSSPQVQGDWARARAGGRVFVIVEAVSVLNSYRPTAWDGSDPACSRALAGQRPAGCVRLRASRTYTGLQRVIVSMYSGR